MELEQALVYKLSNTAGITNLVNKRIYLDIAPQNTVYPLLVCQKVSEPFLHVMQTDPDLRGPMMQIASWSTSYSDVKAVAKQVRTALRDFSGSMGTSDLTVQRIFLESERDFPMVEQETKRTYYSIVQDYRIWFTT